MRERGLFLAVAGVAVVAAALWWARQPAPMEVQPSAGSTARTGAEPHRPAAAAAAGTGAAENDAAKETEGEASLRPSAPAEPVDGDEPAADDAHVASDEARWSLNGRLFADLPFDEGEATMRELGLDRIAGLEALFEQARSLRQAIAGGDRSSIRAAAQEYLRRASKLQTPAAQQQYHALLKEYHRTHGQPAEDVGDIKDVLIPAFGLATELARVQ